MGRDRRELRLPVTFSASLEHTANIRLLPGMPLSHNTDTGVELLSRIVEHFSTQSLLTHIWDVVYRKTVTPSIRFLASLVWFLALLVWYLAGAQSVPLRLVGE